MARERYSGRGSNYDAPDEFGAPSLYGRSAADQLTAAPPERRRRRWVKPIGIASALVTIAAGAATYMAVSHAAAVNMDCTLIVPANPVSAQGLATPFQLVATNPANGPCNEANANQSAFVQGAIVTANGQLTLYDPLVIDQGTKPIATPTPANVPAGASVALWFGFNGNNLTLQSAQGTNALQQGNCVNGAANSIFGQFAYCNAPAFFQTANAAIAANMLQVPALGTAKDGLPCPTVRDFSLVDMDQSDNVLTHYLANGNGQTGQPNAATRAAIQNTGAAAAQAAAAMTPTDLANGSDNRLLDVFVLPTLGCAPWTRPNGAADGMATSSLPLNELQAAAAQAAPVALVPLTDPMAQNNAANDPAKVNLYRAGVDQNPLGAADNGDGATYCNNLFTNAAGIQRVFKDMAIFQNGTSPDPAAATNLFTFLAMRGSAAFTGLNCQNLTGMANPITLTTDGNGVVTAATFTAGGAAAAPSASASAAAGTTTGANPAPSMSAAAAPSAAAPSTMPSAATTKKKKHSGGLWWWSKH
ncbi:MAG TPA: hypothetical protein VJT31_00245 [Rugosimonospora sp.]|nr:hypothetical protein [Rugosimonospora sp.]